MVRYHLTLEYCGTHFHGWQRLPNISTVQGFVEEAILAMTGVRAPLYAASRTDAGVHAMGQSAHFDLTRLPRKSGQDSNSLTPASSPPTAEFTPEAIRGGINHFLRVRTDSAQYGSQIAVTRARVVSSGFHARFSQCGKTYSYLLRAPKPDTCPRRHSPGSVLLRDRVWGVDRPLDLAAMQAACQEFCGRHDFSSFRSAGCQAASPIKTIHNVTVQEITDPWLADEATQLIEVRVSGEGFLYRQVRNMVALLKSVGERVGGPGVVAGAIAARDRRAVVGCAPAHGLALLQVHYPPGCEASGDEHIPVPMGKAG